MQTLCQRQADSQGVIVFDPRAVAFAQRGAIVGAPRRVPPNDEEPPAGGSIALWKFVEVLSVEALGQPPIRAVPECPSLRTQCTLEPSRVRR